MITKDYLPNLQRLAVEEKREQEISWLYYNQDKTKVYYNYDKSKKTGTYEKKTAQIAFLDESEFELVDKLWLQKKTTDKQKENVRIRCAKSANDILKEFF